METSVAFLTSDIGRLMRKRLDCLVRPSGITGAQMRVMLFLHRRPGENQVAIANFFEVEPITAGRMIDRMAAAGFVERRADPADRRAWQVYLTDAGTAMVARLQSEFHDKLDDALKGLDGGERDALVDLLTRVRANLLATVGEETIDG